MQTVSLYVLHHQVHALGRARAVDTLIELHNLRMREFTQDLDLSQGRFLPLNVHQFESIIDLNSDSLIGWLVNGLSHNGIGTRSDLLSKLIVIDVRATRGSKLSQAHVLHQSLLIEGLLGACSRMLFMSLSFSESLLVFFEFSGERILLFINESVGMSSLDVCSSVCKFIISASGC